MTRAEAGRLLTSYSGGESSPSLLSERGRFDRLLKVADSEPPRVRAMLGAIGEQTGRTPAALSRLRASLNPLSRFDFGLLAGLSQARNWQAKGRR